MRIFLALVLAALCGPAGAQAILTPYGLAKQYGFCLYDFTTPNVLESTITWQDADIVVSQSGTEANAANAASSTVTDDGFCFHHSLATTETDTAWVNVLIRDASGDVWFPINLRFETYGHPLAAHPTIGENVVTHGLAQSGSATGIVLAAATTFADGFLAYKQISIIDGTGKGQDRLITSWTSTGDAAVIDRAWDTNPDSTSYYVVYRGDQAFVEVDANGAVTSNPPDIGPRSFLCWAKEIEAVVAGYFTSGGSQRTFRSPENDGVIVDGTQTSTTRSGVTVTCP